MPERPRESRVLERVDEVDRPFTGVDAAAAGDDPVTAAFARGLAQGKAEGRHQLEAELAEERDSQRLRLVESLGKITLLEESLTRRLETLLAEIAVEAASRIVRERVEAGDPVAVRAVREGMEALPPSARIRVRLCPDDIEEVARDLAVEQERGRIELVADKGIARGGCVLESPVGTVDARIETAREAVRAATLGVPEAL